MMVLPRSENTTIVMPPKQKLALRSLAFCVQWHAVAGFGWLAQCVFIDEAFGIKVSKMADTRVARKYE